MLLRIKYRAFFDYYLVITEGNLGPTPPRLLILLLQRVTLVRPHPASAKTEEAADITINTITTV
jgi:hypothetical protein